MKTSAYFLLFAGLALFTFLIAYHGLTDVAAALAVSGWGLLWVTLFHLLPLIIDAGAWRILFPKGHRPSFTVILRARWIGESINGLLPVAQMGGEFAKARMIMQRGFPGTLAGASVVVELTLGVVTQILFTLMGMTLLFYVEGGELLWPVLVGLGVMVLLVAGFCLAQGLGMFGGFARILLRLAGNRDWESLTGGADALDDRIRTLYRQRKTLLYAGIWRLGGWIVGTGEVWLALHCLGFPVSLTQAFLLESLGQAVRAAAFLIPGGLGVQEGGYLVFGGVLGLSSEISLALSLTKRVRELLLGLPGLIVWQIAEGHTFWEGLLKRCGKSTSRATD